MAESLDSRSTLRRLGQSSSAVQGEVGRALAEGARRILADARAKLRKIPGGAEIDVAVVRRGDLALDIVATGPDAAKLEQDTAQSYLRPAAEAHRAEINTLITRAVRKALT